MDRHFGLPLAFAAAAHAALLFGFQKAPRVISSPAEKPGYICIMPVLPPEEPPEPEPEPSTTKSASAAEAVGGTPLPQQPERPTLNLDDRPTISPPPVSPVNPGDIAIIPGNIGSPGIGPGIIGGVLDRVALDNPPRTRFQPSPPYPFEGRSAGLRGEVTVEFTVDEQGHVHDPRVISSSHRMFEEPTLRAVSRWIFEPGKRDGKIVRFKMAAPVIFTLNE